MRNKKGMLMVEAVFIALFASAGIAGISSIDWNIHRRYVEKCSVNNAIQACELEHDQLSKAERIEFIRDK